MKKILSVLGIFMMFGMMSFAVALEPAISITGAEYSDDLGTSWKTMTGNVENGFILPVDGDGDSHYLLRFKDTSSTTNAIDGMYGLYLTYSTTSDAELNTYYTGTATGDYLTYLLGSVEGVNPFAYINIASNIPTLKDAAQNDVTGGTPGTPMIVPGDYPKGTYLVSGELAGTDSDESLLDLKLIVVDETNQQVEVIVDADISLTVNPNPLNFGHIKPGTSSSVEEVTLTPGESDLSVSVAVTGDLTNWLNTDETGSWGNLNGQVFAISAGTPFKFDTRLDIPSGTNSGSYSSTVVYTVSEDI